MSNETIRVGVIGAGANTRKYHIPNLQAQKDVQVVAVANRSQDSAARVCKAFGIERATDDWEEIIYDGDIDAVCIGTWPYMHAPLTIAALESGKHVLCEARMAMNAAEAHAMLEVARSNPTLIAQIVPAPMTLKFDQTICDLIAEGFIGELITVDARIAVGSDFPQWDSPVHWRHLREFSGNNIMSMGIWYEALMRWVGPASSVLATGQSVVRHRKNEAGRRVAMAIPDHIEVMCQMTQGGQMRLCVSSVVGHVPGVDLYVCGTEGTLRLCDEGGDLALHSGKRGAKGLSPVRTARKKEGAWRVEEEFINAVRGREQVSHTDFVTALRYMEWTDAVNAALRTGQRVHLPLDATLEI